MKVSDLIINLQSLKTELKSKDIFIVAQNGLLIPPEIKFCLKDPVSIYNRSKDNVEYIVLK